MIDKIQSFIFSVIVSTTSGQPESASDVELAG
jgi:hypothetical protein